MVLSAAIAVPAASAQTPPETAGQETASSLLARREEAAREEAALSAELDAARDRFASSPSLRESLREEIILRERRLYEVRAELDELDAMLRAAGAAPERSVRPTARPAENPMLVCNAFVRDNLPGEDYDNLLAVQSDEALADSLFRMLDSGYALLAQTLAEYNAAVKGSAADSLLAALTERDARNRALAEQAAEIWLNVFDTKIYSYTYLFDKLSDRQALSRQERSLNELQAQVAATAGRYMYDRAAEYTVRKRFLLGLERNLAENAGLPAAVDSLARALSALPDYGRPKLDLRERMFYDFAEADVARPARYKSAAQIPPVEIFPRGDMYRILLGTYTRPPAVSVFRGVFPLSCEYRQNEKRHYYYAGGYATLEAASDAAARLRRLGFGTLRVVAWHDGEFDPSPSATGAASSAETLYRIEILGTGSKGMSIELRGVIASQAAGKELSRTSSPESGETVFIIGSFQDREAAERLCGALEAADPAVTAQIVSTK